MSFNYATGAFTPLFDLVGDRAAGTDILRGDSQALFNDVGDALEAIFGRPISAVSTYAAVQSFVAGDGITMLLVQGGAAQYDGLGGIYARTLDTVQAHNPPLWLVDNDNVRWRRVSPIVQANATDATTDALMRNGAWGVGGLLPLAGNLSVINETITPGFYGYDVGDGSVGGPAGVTKGSVWHTRRTAGGGEAQLMVVTVSTSEAFPVGSVASRVRAADAWGAWRNSAHQGGVTPPSGNISVTDETILPGHYSFDTSRGSSGGPTGVTKGAFWHTRRTSGGGETQLFVVEASTSETLPVGAVATRSRETGAWGAWKNVALIRGVDPLIGNAGVVDESIAPGTYSYSTAQGSTGAPAGVTRASLTHSRRTSTGGEAQLIIIEASTAEGYPVGSLATRIRTTAAWEPWRNAAYQGGVLPNVGNLGVTDNTILPGFYSYDTAQGSSGGPALVSRGSVWHARRAAGGGETQLIIVEASTSEEFPAGSMATRSRVAGAWVPWTNSAQIRGSLKEIGNASVVDESIPPGTYGYSTPQGSTGAPGHISHGIIYHGRRAAGGGETQLLIVEVSTELPAGALISRARSTGAWSAWLPERGTNANGDYIKHANGLLECWRDVAAVTRSSAELVGGIYRTAEILYDFPHAFIGMPDYANVSPAGDGFGNGFLVAGGSTGTQWQLRFARTVDFVGVNSPALRFYARGRWY